MTRAVITRRALHRFQDFLEQGLGALLLDASEPWRVLARSETPLVEPSEPYETDGFFGNVVFSCGCAVRNDEVTIYYGASDDSVACLTLSLEDIYRNLGV